jgi:hypothetical protein
MRAPSYGSRMGLEIDSQLCVAKKFDVKWIFQLYSIQHYYL